MDPVTQGVVGASASQLLSQKRTITTATALGVLSGMAPDLDVLIRSNSDPLLALEYHRQFTHALIFIPIGALLCAALGYVVFAKARLTFMQTYFFCLAGYATHALLDACTTYGTLLLWPFTHQRFAWNTVSVVDPLFTLPALLLVILAVRRQSKRFSTLAIAWMLSYLAWGVVQYNRAFEVAQSLALSRGHSAINLGVKPSFANLLVWKSVYEFQDRYYVDAVRVFTSSSVFEGTSTQKLDLDQHFPWLDPSSQQATDVERFRWFSNQYLGLDPDDSNRIIDIRYSLIPNEMTGMWGIRLDKSAPRDAHADYTTNPPGTAEMRAKTGLLWRMIIGTHSE